MNEVHHHFGALKEALAHLRSDFAVQTKMHQDIALQQTQLQSLREEVSKLRLSSSVGPQTLDAGIRDSTFKLHDKLPAPESFYQSEVLQESKQPDSLGVSVKSLPPVLMPLAQQREASPIIQTPVRRERLGAQVDHQGQPIESTPSFQSRLSPRRAQALPFSYQPSALAVPRSSSALPLERAALGGSSSAPSVQPFAASSRASGHSLIRTPSEGSFSVQSGFTVVQRDSQPAEDAPGGSQAVPLLQRKSGLPNPPAGTPRLSNGAQRSSPQRSSRSLVAPVITLRSSSPLTSRGSGGQKSKMVLLQQAKSGTQSPRVIVRPSRDLHVQL